MCVIIHQAGYPLTMTPDRPKLKLSCTGLKHFGRYHEVGPHHCNGSRTLQAVRQTPRLLPFIQLMRESQDRRANCLEDPVLHSPDKEHPRTYH